MWFAIRFATSRLRRGNLSWTYMQSNGWKQETASVRVPFKWSTGTGFRIGNLYKLLMVSLIASKSWASSVAGGSNPEVSSDAFGPTLIGSDFGTEPDSDEDSHGESCPLPYGVSFEGGKPEDSSSDSDSEKSSKGFLSPQTIWRAVYDISACRSPGKCFRRITVPFSTCA